MGLPNMAVKEGRERVRSALVNCGHPFPAKRITLNLAPADIPKEGSALDLPIAITILTGSGIVSMESLEKTMFLGELTLDGTLRPVRGALPVALDAEQHGFTRLLLPKDNAREAAVVDQIDVLPIGTLTEAVELLNGTRDIQPCKVNAESLFEQAAHYEIDFSEVKGQEHVKCALEVSAASGLNIIMIGPPGSGKSMLAKRLATILPPISFEEALETTKIHSIHGSLPTDQTIIATRPFRMPHHSVSDAGLIGGGAIPRPGEVSLAHHGILFLDEMPEFSRNVLENLRQPLEDGVVTISRASGSLTFPSRFMLVAAMNPCMCGFYGDTRHSCQCTSQQINRYVSKISGPLLDRIDIHVEVPGVSFDDLHAPANGETSYVVRERVIQARKKQRDRFFGTHLFCNAHMQSKEIKQYCQMGSVIPYVRPGYARKNLLLFS